MIIKTIKKLGLTGVLAGAIVGSYSLGRMNEAERYEAVPVHNNAVETPKSLDSHTLAVLRLKNALGNRLENEAGLYEMDSRELNLFAEIYEDVEDFKDKYNIDSDKNYQEFNPSSPLQLSLAEMTRYEKGCPWNLIPDNGDFSEEQKVAVYTWGVFKDFHDEPIAPVW